MVKTPATKAKRCEFEFHRQGYFWRVLVSLQICENYQKKNCCTIVTLHQRISMNKYRKKVTLWICIFQSTNDSWMAGFGTHTIFKSHVKRTNCREPRVVATLSEQSFDIEYYLWQFWYVEEKIASSSCLNKEEIECKSNFICPWWIV